MINKASQLLYVGFTTGQKVEVPLVSLSCSGAKDTTQSLWETVGLLKSTVTKTLWMHRMC